MLGVGVSSNPSTPISLLEKLSDDEYRSVRGAVAKNPNTPISLLVVNNPNTPPELKTLMMIIY